MTKELIGAVLLFVAVVSLLRTNGVEIPFEVEVIGSAGWLLLIIGRNQTIRTAHEKPREPRDGARVG